MLQLSFMEIDVNLAAGEQHGREFRCINPLGQVPVLADGELFIRDSHAILTYLSDRYGDSSWLPQEPAQRAAILQWLFFDANDLHNGVGLARNYYSFGVGPEGGAAQQRGRAALGVIEEQLGQREWLELGRPTLADISCSPLIEVADEAGIDVGEYPNIQGWLARLRELPGYLAMPRLGSNRP